MTKEIRSVAVLGGGTMGAGIAGLCAERDIKVLIAYSSVVHISLIISNLFSKNF